MFAHRASRFFALVLGTLTVGAAVAAPEADIEAPLSEFPYTPGLDVRAMDRTAKPCEDFYQYTCGGWRKNNPIPADQASWSVYGKLYRDNQRYLWGILDSLAKPSGVARTPAQVQLGDYFAACMDEQAVDALGAKPLAPWLRRIDRLGTRAELPELVAALQRNLGGGGFFFGFGPQQDYADSSRMIAGADAAGLGLPDRDYYLKDDDKSKTLRTQYAAHVQRMFELLGDAPALAAKNAATVLAMETELARHSLTRVERRDPHKLFNPYDRKALRALTPHFDWDPYLTAIGIDGLDSFNVGQPVFFKALDAQLATAPLADIRTYLRWHLVHADASSLSGDFVRADFDFFSKTLRGVPELQPRWKRCVALTDEQLGESLGKEFVARAFSPALKARTLHMTTQIEQAMAGDIQALTWMDAPTKAHALEKLHAIVNKIGYPDAWRDYSSIRVARDDFAGNVDRASRFEHDRQVAKIGKPVDRGEWGMTPPTVNAYFDPQFNDINFPAGVLQPPLYDPAMDDAPNYGNTGGTIGHELTHGFDDQGRQFDAHGNLKDWWSPESGKAFTERAQCIVDQYAQYTVVDDVKINSQLTQGEDIADLGGLMLALVAWKAETAGKHLEDRDGLTPEQRFFVGYAQWACENDRPENQRVNAATNPHSPGRYRVNGLMVNMPEFQQAFQCKAGDPMVAAKPCRVW
jgi:endothelin-converting enzyme/putative endopeptidase